MTAKISDYKNSLYSREYSNDIKPQQNVIARIALAAIPFLPLHPFLRFPTSVMMGGLRVWTHMNQDWTQIDCGKCVGAAVAVTALAASLFQHRLGMIVTTVQDIVIEMNRPAGNQEEAIKSLLKLGNDLVYLALLLQGGLELSLAAFVMQAVINVIQSKDEFKNDRWIEGVANLLMAGVRVNQSYTQYQQLKRNGEIEAAIKKVFVGQLHEKWRFPSDHLPVGVEVNGVKIISWNVLNNAYIDWVTEKDSQGLNGSMISELNVPASRNGLTKRDVFVAEMVQHLMAQGQVVALQECGQPFLQYFQNRLPADWGIVKSFDTKRVDQDVILYNKAHLTYQPNRSETAQSAYLSFPGRPLQNACFSCDQGRDLRVINAHIPGDPDKPGREEFARYVRSQHAENAVTIALGDNNFERDEMLAAYRKAGFTEFSLHSPWQTNIDPYTKESKAIDHLFVMGKHHSRDLSPDEILVGGNLREMINLLKMEVLYGRT